MLFWPFSLCSEIVTSAYSFSSNDRTSGAPNAVPQLAELEGAARGSG